jgi:hypothetical protein
MDIGSSAWVDSELQHTAFCDKRLNTRLLSIAAVDGYARGLPGFLWVMLSVGRMLTRQKVVLREWIFVADLSNIACMISLQSQLGYSCQSKWYWRESFNPVFGKLYLDHLIKG